MSCLSPHNQGLGLPPRAAVDLHEAVPMTMFIARYHQGALTLSSVEIKSCYSKSSQLMRFQNQTEKWGGKEVNKLNKKTNKYQYLFFFDAFWYLLWMQLQTTNRNLNHVWLSTCFFSIVYPKLHQLDHSELKSSMVSWANISPSSTNKCQKSQKYTKHHSAYSGCAGCCVMDPTIPIGRGQHSGTDLYNNLI